MRTLLLATLACPALLAAGSATADELRVDGPSEAPPSSVVVIRGTAVTVVTPAAFGSELEVIRGAPALAQDAPRSGGRAEDPSLDAEEGQPEEDSSWYYRDDYVHYTPIWLHVSHRLDETRGGHSGRHGHGAGHRARGGQRLRMVGRR